MQQDTNHQKIADNTALPILYSFRRCPYAMRARMALAYANINLELREVVLRDKPPSMLQASSKGTVPVLLFDDKVIDESFEVMMWAINQHDPDGWLNYSADQISAMIKLVEACEADFKPWLDKYKYSDRHPEHSQQYYCEQALPFLQQLEARLNHHKFLFGHQLSISDIAVVPFVRQFANVSRPTFDKLGLPNTIEWLDRLLASDLFLGIMKKYPQWQAGDEPTYFP